MEGLGGIEWYFDEVFAIVGKRTITPQLFAIKDLDKNTDVSRCWYVASFVNDTSAEGESVVLTTRVPSATCPVRGSLTSSTV